MNNDKFDLEQFKHIIILSNGDLNCNNFIIKLNELIHTNSENLLQLYNHRDDFVKTLRTIYVQVAKSYPQRQKQQQILLQQTDQLMNKLENELNDDDTKLLYGEINELDQQLYKLNRVRLEQNNMLLLLKYLLKGSFSEHSIQSSFVTFAYTESQIINLTNQIRSLLKEIVQQEAQVKTAVQLIYILNQQEPIERDILINLIITDVNLLKNS